MRVTAPAPGGQSLLVLTAGIGCFVFVDDLYQDKGISFLFLLFGDFFPFFSTFAWITVVFVWSGPCPRWFLWLVFIAAQFSRIGRLSCPTTFFQEFLETSRTGESVAVCFHASCEASVGLWSCVCGKFTSANATTVVWWTGLCSGLNMTVWITVCKEVSKIGAYSFLSLSEDSVSKQPSASQENSPHQNLTCWLPEFPLLALQLR